MSARHSCLISPNVKSFTAIMESGMGRGSTTTLDTRNPSHVIDTLSQCDSEETNCCWNICCASACEFDRLKQQMGPTRDMDSLDHLFSRIYAQNDIPIIDDGVFSCDSEAGDSLDSGSEGDASRDTDGPHTPISPPKSQSYACQLPFSSKWGSPPSSILYPGTSMSAYSLSSSLTSTPNVLYDHSSSKPRSNDGDTRMGSGISGLVEQLGPVLDSC